MTPVAYTRNLLVQNASKLTGVSADHIYSFMVNPNDWDNQHVILLITELPASEPSWGNDSPIYKRLSVQIEFYYPPDFTDDMAAIEQSVVAFLRGHHYYLFSEAGHALTPDDSNIVNTFKFNFTEEDI